ncbi:ARPP-1 family domain-containing protein [Pollutibacter soli]|uniref:ARPP-1 family domain-containing protein n=1 Tax=Pollutibacter soli TaxID=3034157 RepID=UPI003AF80AD0
MVEKLSIDTLIIISGDLVKGGWQDWVIHKDVLPEPKSGKKHLPVFCVEIGQWQIEGARRDQRSIAHLDLMSTERKRQKV